MIRIRSRITCTVSCMLCIACWTAGDIPVQVASAYAALKDPAISAKSDQKMLVVEMQGDPNVVGQQAFSQLFGTFFKIPGVKMAPPRVRWLNIPTDPRSQWIGLYALPLPESVTMLPDGAEGARIETWRYEMVAEILHIGPYSAEGPTIDQLHRFIDSEGYQVAGPHEEEYLKSPGMGNISPSDYQTIIRYPVVKK